MVGEIRPSREFYDYEAKYLDKGESASRLLIPAPIPEGLSTLIREVAIDVAAAVEARGLARIDFLLDGSARGETPTAGEVYVGEIKLQGTVESFDQFVVLLRNTVSQMVYKHAISTVVPARNVKVGDGPHAHEPHDPVVED